MAVLLDNGHGGLINGIYQTKGKRSPVWEDGSQLYEGEFNRAIVARIAEFLTSLSIPYVLIAPESQDIKLDARIVRANKYKDTPCFLVSVHANAGRGKGFEIYTSRGQTKSDEIADVFVEEFKKAFPGQKVRCDYSDGDIDKEADFVMLQKTAMPAVMTENFFMDNEKECRGILLTRSGRDRIARFHVEAIRRMRCK